MPCNHNLRTSRISPSISTDFDARRAKLTDSLVPLVRFLIAAARTGPHGRAAGQAVGMWDAGWAARLGRGEVGAGQEVAVGRAASVEFEPGVVVLV